MIKINLLGIKSFISARECKQEAHESRLQKFLCWLFGCCPDKVN
jgi:hypothetical protein